MLFTILLFVIAVVTSSGLPATSAAASPSSPHATFLDQNDSNTTNPTFLTFHENEVQVGSSCYGLEGEWNCMTTTFQRCASGQWSVVMDTAYGTVCEPAGFTYDFQPAFASWFPPADATETITCVSTATATATDGPTEATGTGTSDAPKTAKAAPSPTICRLVFGLAGTTLLMLTM
ncbi:hypothetical protein Daus18300_001692 [Diaporthe australafricana]|uniref:Uncharacterized protein n=1 Tax=Diaporthe australafricana TaxID=127596 RepID=A0ABR3XW85_9PEZI